MTSLTSDWNRLQLLLGRLQDLERRIPKADDRAILEVARSALREEVSTLAHRLGDGDYWRRRRPTARRAG